MAESDYPNLEITRISLWLHKNVVKFLATLLVLEPFLACFPEMRAKQEVILL